MNDKKEILVRKPTEGEIEYISKRLLGKAIPASSIGTTITTKPRWSSMVALRCVIPAAR